MKLFAVFIFSSCVLSIKADGKCKSNLDACSDIANIATITCDGTSCSDWPAEIEHPEITEINAKLCRNLCQEHADSADTKCEFYRWESNHLGTTTCSFQTECGEGDIPTPWCDVMNCITGQIGCTEEEVDVSTDCTLSAPVAWNHGFFHLTCINTNSVGETDLNIYDPDITTTPLHHGIKCSTARQCAAWGETASVSEYYRKLAITCDGTDGTWKSMEVTGSNDESGKMVGDGGDTIVEPECSTICEDLTLTHINQEGADLICDTPLVEEEGEFTLSDGNSCILLCDNHLRMEITCEFTEEGDKIWEDDGTEVNDDYVKCYDDGTSGTTTTTTTTDTTPTSTTPTTTPAL